MLLDVRLQMLVKETCQKRNQASAQHLAQSFSGKAEDLQNVLDVLGRVKTTGVSGNETLWALIDMRSFVLKAALEIAAREDLKDSLQEDARIVKEVLTALHQVPGIETCLDNEAEEHHTLLSLVDKGFALHSGIHELLRRDGAAFVLAEVKPLFTTFFLAEKAFKALPVVSKEGKIPTLHTAHQAGEGGGRTHSIYSSEGMGWRDGGVGSGYQHFAADA